MKNEENLNPVDSKNIDNTKNDSADSTTSKKKISGIKKHIPFYLLEVVLLVVSIFALITVSKIIRAERVNLNTDNIQYNEMENEEEDEVVLDTSRDYIADDVSDDIAPEDEDIDRESIEKELYKRFEGRFNIAFFGVDSREGALGAGTRSDSIMICSIDMDTHEVKLVSIYRDTYLNLGNGSYNKCNSAYALGGPEQALSMINMNTDLYIDQYVTIGFEGLVDAIDALGGIPIDVEEKEIFHLNNYQMAMAEELGVEYTPVIYPGKQILNGLQATAYCRIRYTKGDDFKRAERQRTVIAAMVEKAGKVSVASLTDAASKVLPSISTSLTLSDIISMLSLVGNYEVTVSEGFPFDGMRGGGAIGTKGSCVVPKDLTKNVKKLHKILYDEEDYKPSAKVKEYSAKIAEDTEEYLQY